MIIFRYKSVAVNICYCKSNMNKKITENPGSSLRQLNLYMKNKILYICRYLDDYNILWEFRWGEWRRMR